jgi:hypothetical protein
MVIIHDLKTEDKYVKLVFTLTEFDRDRKFIATIISGLMKDNGISSSNIPDFALHTFEFMKKVRTDNIRHEIDSNDFCFEFNPNDRGNEFQINTYSKGLSNIYPLT